MAIIDTTFDFRSDTPPGKDPDSHSPTLRKYHQLLWSKPLPSGQMFDLSASSPGAYLLHESDLGRFRLSSDAVIPSFRKVKKLADVLELEMPGLLAGFNGLGYTIGGMMIWPGYRVDNKITINGHRGFHPAIKDRFDLTLECVRRHYLGEDSPLAGTLNRYADYFSLFGSFSGFVRFFLLEDAVTDDCRSVKFHAPFHGFDHSPVPDGLESYLAYVQEAESFIRARNHRIANLSL